MKKDWIYFGVFLDEESQSKLINLTTKLSKFYSIDFNSWKKYCHHMTIQFNDRTYDAELKYKEFENYFGNNVNLTATHVGLSNDALAVRVECEVKTQNKIPHITLATPQNGKPVNSNYIKSWKKLSKPIELTGTIQDFVKNKPQ